MKNLIPILILALATFSSCQKSNKGSYASSWDKAPNGVWTGPGLWANRLQDWKIEDGKLLCINTNPMRTVQLTSYTVGENTGNINTSIKIFTADSNPATTGSSAGLLIGSGWGLDYRTASLIHHSTGPGAGLFFGLEASGNLFIKDFETKDSYLVRNSENTTTWYEAMLIINIKANGDEYSATITAVDPTTNKIIDKLEKVVIPSDRIPGNLAVVSHAGKNGDIAVPFAFMKWKVSGSKLVHRAENTIGPIMGLQYTLSRETLKMTVQMAPIGVDENNTIELQILKDEHWETALKSEIEQYSFTANFRIDNWIETNDIPFRIVYNIERGSSIQYSEEGIIKHDPVEKEKIVTLSLSCVEQVVKASRDSWAGIDAGEYPWDWGVLYPHTQLTDNLKTHKPDFLFFAGDQVYEGASPTRADVGPLAHLDYLYKWYLWCQTYLDLTLVTPSVTIPDDHDVYHGNIWGEGGKATPPGTRGAAAQDAGGYKMSPEFVNMVHQTQTSHLPDPYDPEPVEQGIRVYFTECNIGGVSFAILEDRKFKSAPKALLPEADIYNGWPRNPEWNAKKDSRIDATLLGDRQLDFLAYWAEDWSNGTWMKAVLSQTLFANVATIPKEAMTDDIVATMEIPDSAQILDTDKVVSDFDSNGWPQTGRDKAIKIFRKAFAPHLVGDQHLGSTIHYGLDTWRDAGFAICSPATGNIWPRRWHPPVKGRQREEGWPSNLGDFEDGFGNKITVYAVTNPHKTNIHPSRHHELSPGYSVVSFDRESRKIELANWPYYAGPDNGEPFPNWPLIIDQADNYGREAAAWLPELNIEGLENPVIKIFRERTSEMEYAIRINGQNFQPKVFYFGSYTIEVGEPDSELWQKLEGIVATSFKDRKAIDLNF